MPSINNGAALSQLGFEFNADSRQQTICKEIPIDLFISRARLENTFVLDRVWNGLETG